MPMFAIAKPPWNYTCPQSGFQFYQNAATMTRCWQLNAHEKRNTRKDRISCVRCVFCVRALCISVVLIAPQAMRPLWPVIKL